MFMLGGCTQILAGKTWFETGHGIYFVNITRVWPYAVVNAINSCASGHCDGKEFQVA